MTSSCYYFKNCTTFALHESIAPKNDNTQHWSWYSKKDQGIRVRDYIEHDYTRLKGHKRRHGTSRILNVMVKSHMMLFDMIKKVKTYFMSLGVVYFLIY